MEATLQQALKSYWTGLLRQVLFGLGLSELWAELAALSLLRARGTARGTRDRRIDMGATSWPDPPRRLSPSGSRTRLLLCRFTRRRGDRSAMTHRFVRTAICGTVLSLILVTFAPLAQDLPRAGAASSAYSVAFGGCFEQTPPAGTGVPPTVSDYIEVQAYGLPSSASLTEPDGIPNTVVYVQGGNPVQPGGTPIAAPVHNGVPSGFLAGLNGGIDLSVQVAYVVPDGTVRRLPVIHVTLPTAASCGITGTTTVSTPPGRVTAPIVGMAATPDAAGQLAGRGPDRGIFTFGDAGVLRSTGGHPLTSRSSGMAATPDGKGYWLVGPTGGSSASATPECHGSTGAAPQQARRRDGRRPRPAGGYWLVAADGDLQLATPRSSARPALSVEPAMVGHVGHPHGTGLLIGGERRRDLQLRRRRSTAPRAASISTGPSWAWRRHPTDRRYRLRGVRWGDLLLRPPAQWIAGQPAPERADRRDGRGPAPATATGSWPRTVDCSASRRRSSEASASHLRGPGAPQAGRSVSLVPSHHWTGRPGLFGLPYQPGGSCTADAGGPRIIGRHR